MIRLLLSRWGYIVRPSDFQASAVAVRFRIRVLRSFLHHPRRLDFRPAQGLFPFSI